MPLRVLICASLGGAAALRVEGGETTFAATAKEAVQSAQLHPPDALIVDAEQARLLAGEPSLSAVPRLAIDLSPEARAAALNKLSADPAVVERRQARYRASVPSEIAELIPMYLETKRAELQAVILASNAQDSDTVRKLGHNMKGSGAGYGFPPISQIGRIMEESAKNRDWNRVQACTGALADYLDRVVVTYESRY